MVQLHAGKSSLKEWREGCRGNKVRAPNTANDLSLYREAYQKQADIIPVKILHQLCLAQVTGAESVENQKESRENYSLDVIHIPGVECPTLRPVSLREPSPLPEEQSLSSQLTRNR